MSGKRITLRDIARELDCSLATVSYALNGTGRVAPEKRRQIIEKAQSMGYKVDRALSALAAYRQHQTTPPLRQRLAMLVLDPMQPIWKSSALGGLLRQAAQEFADSINSSLDIIDVPAGDLPELRQTMKACRARAIQGIVIACLSHVHVMLPKRSIESGVKFVIYGDPDIDVRLEAVNVDFWRDTYNAFLIMFGRGLRRIGLILPRSLHMASRQNIFGAFMGVQARVNIPESSVIFPLLWDDRHQEVLSPIAVDRYVRLNRLEGIIANTEVYPMLQELGYRMPEDISFIGRDLVTREGPISGMCPAYMPSMRNAFERLDLQLRQMLLGSRVHVEESYSGQYIFGGMWWEGNTTIPVPG